MEFLRWSWSKTRSVTGKLYRYFVVRPVQRYNIGNRAMKLIDRIEESKTPVVTAPKHYPDEKFLEELIKNHPEIMEDVKKTPQELIDAIKKFKVNVSVVPFHENVKIETEDYKEHKASLPHFTRKPPLFAMGVKDPERVPIGKISLREAMEMIRAYQFDPQEYSVEKISTVHELDEKDVENILQHFKGYQIYQPAKFYEESYRAQRPWYKKDRLENWLLGESGFYEIYRYEKEVREREFLLAEKEEKEAKWMEAYEKEKEKRRIEEAKKAFKLGEPENETPVIPPSVKETSTLPEDEKSKLEEGLVDKKSQR